MAEPADVRAIREKCRLFCTHFVLGENLDRLARVFGALNAEPERRGRQPTSFNPHVTGHVPKRGYVLCHTPRSGSTLLTTTLTHLTQEGVASLGYPSEIFNTGYMEQRGRHYGCRTLDDFARWALWETTDSSGTFGVKGDLFQLLPFFFTRTFQELWSNIRFIYLTREDILMQAISLVIANHTGLWTSESEVTGSYAGDTEEIAGNAAMIAENMADWEKLYAFSGIRPLRLTYEEVERDLKGAVRKLARHAGATMPSQFELSVVLSKTRGEKNDELRRLIVETCGLASQRQR